MKSLMIHFSSKSTLQYSAHDVTVKNPHFAAKCPAGQSGYGWPSYISDVQIWQQQIHNRWATNCCWSSTKTETEQTLVHRVEVRWCRPRSRQPMNAVGGGGRPTNLRHNQTSHRSFIHIWDQWCSWVSTVGTEAHPRKTSPKAGPNWGLTRPQRAQFWGPSQNNHKCLVIMTPTVLLRALSVINTFTY